MVYPNLKKEHFLSLAYEHTVYVSIFNKESLK